MGIRRLIEKAGGKAADKVAQLASLSPEQLREVDEFRDLYLNEMPDPNDPSATELTMRLLASAGIEIYNAYLPQIKQLYLPLKTHNDEEENRAIINRNIRYFRITKWVTDKKENNLEKLVNVYATLSNEDCNIALIFHRTVFETEVYLAVTNNKWGESNTDANNYKTRLFDALRGNFPGSEWNEPAGAGIIPFLDNDTVYSIASASNIPTEKSKQFISQTIEKLLDGIVPDNEKKEYTLILLATPIRDVEERKLRLAELYSGLAPYAGWQTNYTFTDSNTTNSTATFGVNAGVSAGIQHGQNQSTTNSAGTTDSNSHTDTENENVSNMHQENTTETDNTQVSVSEAKGETTTDTINNQESVNVSQTTGEGTETNVGVELGGVSGGGSFSHNISDTVGTTVTEGTSSSFAKSLTETVTKAAGKAISKGVSDAVTKSTGKAVADTIGHAITNTVAKTAGAYKGVNFGGNFGANFARSSNISVTVGKNEGITQSYTNFTIKHTLQVLEEQMKRYEESVALGMWDFAAYVLSEDVTTVNNVAHSYIALTQGEKSYLSQASVNMWRGDVFNEKEAAKEIGNYLREFRHPEFGLNPDILLKDHTFSTYPSLVTATTSLSGKELAYSLNFPQRSIVGLPVLQCAEFGRNVVSYEETDNGIQIPLGNIFHMNHEESVPVSVSGNSLTGHTFVTGSTGAGKSNTVYQILYSARKKDVNFLVVEPAKGEYKTVFGGYDDVYVYGTNPAITPLLKINPFSFPKEIHILEHLDRLVEIFNVCWPMYAAMPAVLKNAIEKAYEDCGWNLVHSSNEFGGDLYPTFADVARNIKTIIDSSEYDSENKGAYKGSLLTRLQSLSNGINGLIFVTDEIPSEQLFDENVIIDLSRVGSSETKSLLMGMIVLKLQEYRMAVTKTFNNDLKHITVLEEAHNLLKRTSTEQPAEGGNLLGKSVEMLANSIAEMRTYGEGFIIADQAPGLLDMSVIRNTNTKIIMRLPDEDDRKIVGKAANLNDDQITELAKLPKGVGAVYQNEWVQPVLCKVKHFKGNRLYDYLPENEKPVADDLNDRLEIASLLSDGAALNKEIVLKDIRSKMNQMKLSAYCQVSIMAMLIDPPEEPKITKFAPIMKELFPDVMDAISSSVENTNDNAEWTQSGMKVIDSYGIKLNEQMRRDIIQSVMTYYLLVMKNDITRLQEWSVRGGL